MGEGQAEEAHPVTHGLNSPRRPGADQRVDALETVASGVKQKTTVAEMTFLWPPDETSVTGRQR